MTVVVSETSPLNCRWISWNGNLPVCKRPPDAPHPVVESDCAFCEHWEDRADAAERIGYADGSPLRGKPEVRDPLNRETCPRCGSHDIILMSRDAVVQSFGCTICHQRWLATRPWPLLRETRSRQGDL